MIDQCIDPSQEREAELAEQIAKLDEVDAENNAKIGELQVRPSTTIHQKNKISTLTSRPLYFFPFLFPFFVPFVIFLPQPLSPKQINAICVA